MRTYLDCIPCLMHQALRAARLSTDDEQKVKQVLDEVGSMIKCIPMESPPPETAMTVYRKIKDITKNPDPYFKQRNFSTRKALALYPGLKNRVKRSSDRLLAAIKVAIGGNIIDFGVNRGFDIKEEIEATFNKDLAYSEYERFKEYLAAADEILYLGDNAGESVFDRILIEELHKPVTYVVRSIPVINDVTYVDAVMAGLNTTATIMSSGSDAPGVVLDSCSKAFCEKFFQSQLVISKGQGNFEALSDKTAPVFFLLITKCPIIARDIGVNIGDVVLKGPKM